MTPAQVQAAIERLERKAVNERDDMRAQREHGQACLHQGRAEGFVEAARILTEALAESDAAPALHGMTHAQIEAYAADLEETARKYRRYSERDQYPELLRARYSSMEAAYLTNAMTLRAARDRT